MTPGSSLKPTNKRHRPNQYVTFERNQTSNVNMTPGSVNLPPSTNHYEQVDGVLGLPVTSTNHYEQVDDDFGLPVTSTNHYDEINDLRGAPSPQHVEYLTPTSRLYNTTSPQDNEPPSIYSRPRPVTSPSEDHQTSGPYNNAPGQHGKNPDIGVISKPKENTETVLPGANYTNVTMATDNPYVDAMSELKETTLTAGPGANYTNVTMATDNPYVDAMSELKETTLTAGPGTNYTNVTMATDNPYVDAMSESKETTVTAGPGKNYSNVIIATENPFVDAMSEV